MIVFQQIRVHEFVLLAGEGVGDVSGIRHGNLLIPTLLTHSMLALERIEARYADVEVGQCHRDGRVAHVLREVGCGTEAQTDARECGAPTDG